jgi:uncharacterized protein YyaL (SSP411 family)
MGEATSKVPWPASLLTLGLLLAVSSAAAATSDWSPETFATAKEQGRPAVVLVTDATYAASEAAWRADPAVAARLSADFVEVRVDRLLRPDVAEILGVAVREGTGFVGLPLLAALSADGVPVVALTGARALDPGEMAGFADAAAALARGSRPEARWTAAIDVVRAAQKPSPALRPLDVTTVEAATRAAIAAPELDLVDGPFPHAAVGLLLAEYRRARRPEVLKLATTALDLRLARPRDASEESVAQEAVALSTWARAHDIAGRGAYGEEAARLAARLRRQRREDGCFPESAADGRVIAQTNGLAVGALALSGRVAGRAVDVDASRAAAACVLASLGPAGALSRGAGAPAGSALLDDHAALAAGLLELYDATGEGRWRTEAQAVADAALGRFLDVEGGGFFLTDAAHQPALARLKHAFDGALPSANGTMAQALLHLSRATGEPRYATLARPTVDAFLGDLQRAPRALFALASAAVEVLGPAAALASADASGGPSVVTRGRVTLQVRSPEAPVLAGGTADVEIELDVAPGAFVVAHGVRAKDLAGLGVSVPSEGVRAASPRYPPAATVRPPWNAVPLDVYQGRTLLPVRVTLARDVPAGPRRLRVRVVFQECDASACRTPDGAVLEVPVTVVPSTR